jgi:hypothetical protein
MDNRIMNKLGMLHRRYYRLLANLKLKGLVITDGKVTMALKQNTFQPYLLPAVMQAYRQCGSPVSM